jgi:hypothetical protein
MKAALCASLLSILLTSSARPAIFRWATLTWYMKTLRHGQGFLMFTRVYA